MRTLPLATAVFLALTALSFPSAATAAEPTLTPVTAPPSSEASINPAAEARQQLQRLVGQQTPEEIAEIVDSGRPAELLVGDDDQVIAAYYKDPSYTTLSISTRFVGALPTTPAHGLRARRPSGSAVPVVPTSMSMASPASTQVHI